MLRGETSAEHVFVPAWTALEFAPTRLRYPRALDPWNPTLPKAEPATVIRLDGRSSFSDPWALDAAAEASIRMSDHVGSKRPDEQRNRQQLVTDFWSLSGEIFPSDCLKLRAQPVPEWVGNLPWFDASKAENPFKIALRRDNTEELSAKRARWLVSLMDIPEKRRRLEFVAFFRSVFVEFPHANTFRVLSALAVGGAEPEILRTGCAFRMRWLQRSDWWSQHPRSKYFLLPSALMPWSRAVRFAQLCQWTDPADLIEDEWLADWRLSDEWNFADFVEMRLKLWSQGIWQTPGITSWSACQ